MTRCSILECRNNSRTSNLIRSGVSYHRFPKDSDLRDKWIAATGRINWTPTKTSCICSEHFAEKEILLTDKGYRYLNPDVVPTKKIMIYQNESSEEENSSNTDLDEDGSNSETPKRKAYVKTDPLNIDPVTNKSSSMDSSVLAGMLRRTRILIIKKDLQIKRLQAQNRRMRQKLENMEKYLKPKKIKHKNDHGHPVGRILQHSGRVDISASDSLPLHKRK
ncbi:THAP domain-containing protein 5 [Amyelois transitella]|uniref:THAP domain-containing protein 5 n=1 Tax=Amyelois transitella TaxID=680683 RepID=UPI00067C3250|nr:THAP domain-containing protein 5 [Amyelois transitella]